MAISKSTPYVRYKKDFTSSLHLGTIHIESEYLDRTQKTTIESIHGMTWHNKVVNENKELNLLSDTQLELTDLEKQYWNTGEKRVSVDEIHTLEEVEPNEDGTYTYTVNSMEGEYIEIYNGINNITSTSDGLDGQFEIVYDTTEEDINGNIALDAVAPQYEITDSGVGAIIGAKSTGLTLVNHITESSKEEVVAIEQQEGQYFTIENTVEGNIKSAILKGQTLVNLNHPTSKGEYRILDEERWQTLTVWSSDYNTWSVEECAGYKPNTKYFAIVEVVENTLTNLFYGMAGSSNSTMFAGDVETLTFEPGETGVKRGMFTSRADFTNVTRGARSSTETNGTVGTHIKFRIMVVEYQEGMEYWDIPFFEGIKSVKMPVLTATGKNLLPKINFVHNKNLVETTGVINDITNNNWAEYEFVPVPKNKTTLYINIGHLGIEWSRVVFYDENKGFISAVCKNDELVIPTGAKYLRMGFVAVNNDSNKKLINKIMLCETKEDAYSEYEPYKSNILTVNEEVELRGIGEVQDELNVVTGELTERIGEIVLDGSGFYINKRDETSITFVKDGNPMIAFMNRCINNRFSNLVYVNNTIHVNVNISEFADINEFKESMAQNNLIIQFHKKDESIKTVDLTVQNQDGNTIPHIQTQQGITHVSTSSDVLTPTVEMSCSYDTIIKPNTTYTIKLDRPNVSDTMYLQVDLGGTMMMLDADVNAFTIKTPNTLSHSQLRLSGTGNTVKEIIVLEGNRVNDKIEYFEGMENVENPILVVSNCPFEEVTFKKYQSTTLSLNEPIQLRSIGNVHDEINYETGEYIQRIGECIYEDDLTPTYNKQIGGYLVTMQVKGNIGLAVKDGMGAISDKLINQGFTDYDFGIYGNLDGNLRIFDKTVKSEEEFINKYRGTKFQFILLEPIITKIDTTILDQNNSYKSSQQTYDEQTYVSVQSDTVVTPTSSVDYEIYSSTGTVTGTSATIENAEVGTPVSGVVYGETLLNVIQEPSEDEYVITGDNFEGQSGTLENTVEGSIKSAILKGNTLVNVLDIKASSTYLASKELTGFSFNAIQHSDEQTISTKGNYKKGSDYTLLFNSDHAFTLQIGYDMTNTEWKRYDIKIGRNIIKVTTLSDTSRDYIMLRTDSNIINHEKVTLSNFIILEGDYSSYSMDIPYFEGMQSVRMPVLTTTGKNLFELPQIDEMLEGVARKYIKLNLKPNTNYTYNSILDKKGNASEFNFYGWISNDINSNFTGYLIFHWNLNKTFSKTFNTGNDEWYFHILSDKQLVDDYRDYLINFQIEEGSIATSYEPHKTNILTVNEEVELRGIGEVKDELNVITGELTQRIGEVVLDGSEDWTTYNYYGTQIFKTIVIGIRDDMNELMCNRINKSNAINNDTFHFKATSDGIEIMLDDSSITTIDNFKQYISLSKENPIIIQYQLAIPSIKTVSTTIVDQDDKPVENLHTFDTTTHINTYTQGGGLIPFVNIPENISYDTVLKANTQYTIKLNRTNIVEGTPLTVNLGGTELSIEDSTDSFTITTPSTLTNNTLSISGTNNKVKEVMVIEGDCVDRDLDFFEGFISVENPMLTTTKRNVFNEELFLTYKNIGYKKTSDGYTTTKYFSDATYYPLQLKPNTTYYLDKTADNKGGTIICIKIGKTVYITGNTGGFDTISYGLKTFTTDDTGLIHIKGGSSGYGNIGQHYIEHMWIHEGTTAIPYEPYQGNTLTTYPQVTLRSIGDIKDEWDVVGETVTRRIGKVVLDGSQSTEGANFIKLDDAISDWTGKDKYLLSDKLPTSVFTGSDLLTTPTLALHGGLLYVRGFNSNEEITEYFTNNPTTVQYRLAESITESVRITPPNPQTSTASITIPTQLNHVEDMSDFLVWNPYKEHYVRYNYVEDGVVLDNYTWENLTDLNERQFVEFYNKRTYIDQPYHNYVASHDSKGTSKYVLIEPNQDYTISVRFSELPTCETVKVNLGGTEVEMNVNDPHVHITTPNTLVNNLCSISGDGLDGKVTDILVIHCLEHEGFADIDYFEGIDGIGEIVEVDGIPKSKIVMEQTNGNLIDEEFEVWNNGQSIRMNDNERLAVHPNTKYIVKFGRDMDKELAYTIYIQLFNKDNVQTRIINGGATQESNTREFTTNHDETMVKLYTSQLTNNGSAHRYCDMDLCCANMEKDYIRPRYYDKEEIILPIQLHRINTVYDNFYYDEMKGFYRIQQSIGHKYFVGADSENWTLIERGQRVLRFRYNNADIQMKSLGEYMTNLLPNGTATSLYESCTFNGTTFIVSIDKERLSSESLTAFKEWLANNNLHLYYQLASPLMIDLPEYSSRIEFNTYKDEIYTFFKNCKPTVFTLAVPLDQTYRFYELEQGEGYANRVELTDERMTDEDTLYIDTIHGSGFSNLIENPNNVETLLKPNYQGKAVSHTLTNGKVSSIKVHGFEPNETTIANYNSTLKQYELIVQAQKGQNINTQTLAVPYKLEVYEDGTKDKVYYDEQNKVFRFEGGSVTNPPYNNSYIFNTPLEVFKGIAPRTGLIAEIKVKFNSGTTSARIYYSLDGGATTAYSTLRSMTDEVEYYIGFFNTGGTKLDYATKLSAEAEYINLAPLSSTLPESLIITQIQNISECTFTLDKTYYFDSWIKPLELDVYNGETIITEQSGAIVAINNNGLHKDALTYTDETYTVYWTYVGGEGNVTITLGGTKVEVVGTQGYATLKTAIDGVQDGLIIGGYNLSIKDLMLVKGERIEDLAYFEGSRAVGTAFVDENGETKYKITLVTGSELINDKFENRITFEDNNKHNVVVTKLLGNKPNKK